MQQFALTLFSTMAPTLSAQDLAIVRIHRVPKPSFLPAETPRDVFLRVHVYHVKELLMATFSKAENLPGHYVNIQLLPDLSEHALQHHHNLAIITKALRNLKSPHKLRYPGTLSITHNKVTISKSSLDERIAAHRKRVIIPETLNASSADNHLDPPELEWQIVSHKHAAKQRNNGGSGTHEAFFNPR